MPDIQLAMHSLGAGVGAIEGGGVGAGVAITATVKNARGYVLEEAR